MAGDWIKMRTDLHDDPAVVMISSALKINEDEVVGKLHRLWSWADRHTKDGTAPAITIAWIDRYVGRRGFADAMVLANWLEVTPTGIRIPHFDRHNGESAKSRADATDRKRKSRERHEESVTEVTERSRMDSQKTVTREEKRREERQLRVVPDTFGRFWESWPSSERKVAKAKCAEVWRRRQLDPLADQIIAHVGAMKETEQWRRGYDPAPLTYLNQRRWEDSPVVVDQFAGAI